MRAEVEPVLRSSRARMPEAHGEPSLVEKAGYVPFEKRLMGLLQAGERLRAGRAEEFDFPADIPPEVEIPDLPVVRRPEADIVDVGIAIEEEAERLSVAVKRRQSERAEQASTDKTEGKPIPEVKEGPSGPSESA